MNHADRNAKGRQAKGERNGRAKLNPEKVRSIRREFAEGETKAALAERYGVDPALIRRIVRRELWKSVA